ncbi:MAG TPA: MBL fold metallo-hydrolase [Terracidiphilus sp.]|nr:MBL fold metallo-hydrolase [Terracidiphilus sp.]
MLNSARHAQSQDACPLSPQSLQHSAIQQKTLRQRAGDEVHPVVGMLNSACAASRPTLVSRMPSLFFARRTGHSNSLFATAMLGICFISAAVLPADTVSSDQRTVTKLADGIYEIRHKDAPDHFPQGNTVVIIGDSDVLVVDSCYLPSSAREDIAQIRQWTTKPVRYLLNTHWHNDHTQGNSAYSDAFPGIAILAQVETAGLIGLRVGRYLSEYPGRIQRFQQQLDIGTNPDGKALTEDEKQDLKNAIAGGKAASDAVSAEFLNLKPKFPNVTFEHELNLNLGNREVQLKFLGRGNTAGDAIAYLPKEKILVAGDLVDSPVPYLGSGFPIEQIGTLKKMADMDFETLVPGHGNVLKGKDFVQQEIELLEAVIAAMAQEIGRTSASPQNRFEAIKKGVEQNVDVKAWRQKFAGDDPQNQEFFDVFSWPGLLEAAHAEMWPR